MDNCEFVKISIYNNQSLVNCFPELKKYCTFASHYQRKKGVFNPFFHTCNLDIKQLITDRINEELSGSEYFLVSVKSNESNSDFKFFVDGLVGIGIKVCSKLSRSISAYIDEIEYEQPFRYEISSPGVENPLTDARQYSQHIGRDLAVLKTDDNTIDGELLHVKDESITCKITVNKNKKQEVVIPFADIKESLVKISFKKKKK